MQSQKFGRRMRRFFVLRDHILSYHVTRPADEEEVYSNYSLSSLHITDNTTVEVSIVIVFLFFVFCKMFIVGFVIENSPTNRVKTFPPSFSFWRMLGFLFFCSFTHFLSSLLSRSYVRWVGTCFCAAW